MTRSRIADLMTLSGEEKQKTFEALDQSLANLKEYMGHPGAQDSLERGFVALTRMIIALADPENYEVVTRILAAVDADFPGVIEPLVAWEENFRKART